MSVYYNEIDAFAADWLRNLISSGLIPAGDVDTRSIHDVRSDDLRGYKQHHFFAGIGGWPHALLLANWPDDKPVWTGSCPCQPFSVAGRGKGTTDERHLWPEFFRLISEFRPPIIFGEQVASKAGREWLTGVFSDLERMDYAGAGADLCAASVGAPHIRQRLYWVGVANSTGKQKYQEQQRPEDDESWWGSDGIGRCGLANGKSEWRRGIDGKSRRVKPGVRLLVDGFPNRVGILRGFGNAIVPQVAAEFIKALQ